MSINAYKISLKFYASYLNNKLQQIIHLYISLLKYYRKKLGGKSLDRKLVIANPAIRSRHITKQFLWLSTSTVTPMLNFSVLFLLRNSNVRAILRNPPKYRHKLISFQSSTCAFEVQNQYIWNAFFTAKIQIWQKYLNRLAITLPRSHTIYICT